MGGEEETKGKGESMEHPAMPQQMREFLCFLAKEEQCETAWTHITHCPRCLKLFLLAALTASSVGGGINAFLSYLPEAIALIHELRSEEDLTEFIREQERKGSDG